MEAHEENPSNGEKMDSQNRIDEEEEDSEVEGEDYEPELQPPSQEARLRAHKARLTNLSRKLSSERVQIRVHDVLIKGNTKTKDWVIEAELEELKRAGSLQELLQAASLANFRLQQLGIFHSVNIVLDSGPKELPGTANVVVNIVEASNPLSGEIGYYTKPEVLKFEFDASLKI